jgi:ABC-type dipeptide/oligopeptide/nickel transport system permease subunit
VAVAQLPVAMRMSRALAAGVVARPFVQAARLAGIPVPGLLLRDVLPLVLPQLATQAALSVSQAVLGIAATYLISFVLSLFGVQTAFISLPTQTCNSSGAMIGLAINAVILIVAALTLVADIQQVDQAVAGGAPESSEWYLAYGLLVSLIWIYLESMKIVFRIAMMFGGNNNRD